MYTKEGCIRPEDVQEGRLYATRGCARRKAVYDLRMCTKEGCMRPEDGVGLTRNMDRHTHGQRDSYLHVLKTPLSAGGITKSHKQSEITVR